MCTQKDLLKFKKSGHEYAVAVLLLTYFLITKISNKMIYKASKVKGLIFSCEFDEQHPQTALLNALSQLNEAAGEDSLSRQ